MSPVVTLSRPTLASSGLECSDQGGSGGLGGPGARRSAAPAAGERSGRTIVLEEIPVIDMVEPLPGFPDLHRFTLVRLDEDGLLCALSSLDQPGLRFLVVPPELFFPGYAPEVDDATAESLGLGADAEDALVLVMVNAGGSAAETTANLLAPVVVNIATRRAAQVVLDADLPVRAPLMA